MLPDAQSWNDGYSANIWFWYFGKISSLNCFGCHLDSGSAYNTNTTCRGSKQPFKSPYIDLPWRRSRNFLSRRHVWFPLQRKPRLQFDYSERILLEHQCQYALYRPTRWHRLLLCELGQRDTGLVDGRVYSFHRQHISASAWFDKRQGYAVGPESELDTKYYHVGS